MLEEFRGHVFVNRIRLCEFQRHGKHREAIESHPGGSVRLLEESASWQRLRTIENADVIEPEETAGEKIIAFGVFAIHPPGEVEHQFLKCALKKCEVALAAWPGHLVNAPDCPRVDRRVYIAEGKLVGRDLSVRVHVPFAQEK